MSNAIFIDLEIPMDNFQNPKAFAEDVFAAAKKLTDILDHTNSLGSAKTLAKQDAKNDSTSRRIILNLKEEFFSSILSEAEDMELNQLFHFIDEMKELVRQLDLTFDSRATTTMMKSSPSAIDKNLAIEQYKRLREDFETYRAFAQTFYEVNLAPLKARTGNFGSAAKTTYPAYRYNGAVYHNYRAVGRLIGCDRELRTHMDLQEYLEETENAEVEVIEITL